MKGCVLPFPSRTRTVVRGDMGRPPAQTVSAQVYMERGDLEMDHLKSTHARVPSGKSAHTSGTWVCQFENYLEIYLRRKINERQSEPHIEKYVKTPQVQMLDSPKCKNQNKGRKSSKIQHEEDPILSQLSFCIFC